MTERFSVSLEPELFEAFGQYLEKHGYRNRSEAVRDLIRRALIEEEWHSGRNVIGVLSLVYNHHQRTLQDRLTEIQHRFHDLVIASTHVHLDYDDCLEVVIVRGRSAKVRKMADELITQRGVKDGRLVISGTARPATEHSHRHHAGH